MADKTIALYMRLSDEDDDKAKTDESNSISHQRKLMMDIITNLAIIILFALIFPNAWKNLLFQGVRKSSILKIPYHIVFCPFISFMVLTILHHVILLSKNILGLLGKGEAK